MIPINISVCKKYIIFEMLFTKSHKILWIELTIFSIREEWKQLSQDATKGRPILTPGVCVQFSVTVPPSAVSQYRWPIPMAGDHSTDADAYWLPFKGFPST